MPTFATSHPISVTVSLGFVVGNVRIRASDRTDTVIDVRPIDESSKADLKVAEQTRVEYADGALTVAATKQLSSVFGRTGGIDVTIELPSGSQVRGNTGMGELDCDGRLGECQFKTGFGQIRLDRSGVVRLSSGSGDVLVTHADGDVEVTTGSGAIRIDRVDGPAKLKNSNGDSWIGTVTGELRVNAANGNITVDRAHAGVSAKTANGGVRIGEVTRGAATLQSAAGSLEVGISAGTAAWLDLDTKAGHVRNDLATGPAPQNTDETVAVRARTWVGDIVVRRA
ncbi:DUF4097 family beta strand repeat-containing protein [Micromonospora sp. WMMA1363]|uniref:DUF4097 family beta strand repeat-containing protein n=1 Tax=Micromonospora sp. WMMA1363 TaxID=3053985 RepID=UPI00259CDE1D|nr:DUF4097 family beta strand repeat-containing protein [Micromonospora sp. WMMA1363]MDM4720051.1 DUF4097 family beta strand repeat-containing protein [Micromonospora sp. WMMA1363]